MVTMSAAMMITIHDAELCEKFFDFTASELESREPLTAAGKTSSPVTRLSSRSASRSRSNSVYRAKEWLSMKSRRNVMLLPPDEELEKITKRCIEIATKEKDLMEELDLFLEAESNRNQHKKEMLYKQWSDRVFDPIHTSIKETMETSYPMIDQQKRVLFDKYLEITNHKGAFLETINKREYDPLSINSEPAKTRILNDPLVAQYVDQTLERQVIEGCDRGEVNCILESLGNGRQDTDPVTWLALELVQIDSKVRERTRRGMKETRNESNLEGGLSKEGSGIQTVLHKRSIEHVRGSLQLDWNTQ